jgi:hypothetical protein
LAVGQRFQSALPVGFNQSSNAEFDASEVANDGKHDIGQIVGSNHPEDGWSCAVARLSVVARPEVISSEPNRPGVGHVPCCVVGLSERFEVTFDLRFRMDGEPIPAVLAAFGFEQAFARPS